MTDADKVKNTPKIKNLTGAGDYDRWRTSVAMALFKVAGMSNIATMQTCDTIDFAYFKTLWKDSFYKEAAAERDDEGVKIPVEDNQEYVQQCLEEASSTGKGFLSWLPSIYPDLFASLSDDIQDKVAGVAIGDLIGLIQGIKMAIKHFEVYKPHELEKQYSMCTMDDEGKHDVMQYLTILKQYLNRFKAVNYKITDEKAQSILLAGLNQEIFDQFTIEAERHPYDDYSELERAVKKYCSTAKVNEKLKALQPQGTVSTLWLRGSRLRNYGKTAQMKIIFEK